MEERSFYRFGALALMAGTLLGIVFNLLHPRSEGAIGDAAAELEMIYDSGIWTFDHVMLAIAVVLAGIGLFALLRSMSPNSSWAWLAIVSEVSTSTMIQILIAVDTVALPTVAERVATSPGDAAVFASAAGLIDLNTALYTGAFAGHFGVTPILFGIAVLVLGTYPRWLGWASIVAGGVGFLAGLLRVVEPTTLTDTYLMPASSLLFSVVGFWSGWLLWQRTAEPAQTVAPAAT